MTWKPASREEIAHWWAKVIHHAREASKASQKWNDRKASLKLYYIEREQTALEYTDEQKRVKEDGDPELKAHMGAWDWHRREQERWEGLIQAELAMRQLMFGMSMPTIPGEVKLR